jgi:peptide/nickel transport system permease protein
MGSVDVEYGLKGILRELLSYKSGIFGLFFIFILIIISIFAVVTVPYDQAVGIWRGQGGILLETPRNAQPTWITYFGRNLPKTIKIDSSQENAKGVFKSETLVQGTDIKLVRINLAFDYDYEDFPSEVNIFFTAKYNKSSPILNIFWEKPGNSNTIEFSKYLIDSKDDKLYFSTNQEIREVLHQYAINVLGDETIYELPGEKVLFAVEDETMNSSKTAVVQKGTYKMVIESTVFGNDSDLDVKLVVYGKIHGIAGTDHLRRPLYIALLWGTPIALAFGVTASLTISLLQLVLATISGFYGGRIDSLIQRLTEVYMILPFLPILIMIATFYKFDIWILLVMVIFLNLFGGGVKSTRALVMQIKEYPYIEAARAYGASSTRIIFFYIIPKILPPIVPGLIAQVPGFVFLEAALAFLGLGDPTLPTWGKVINDSFREGALFKGHYYWVLEPGFMLIVTAFAFSFLGFALDKIVNPKLKEV